MQDIFTTLFLWIYYQTQQLKKVQTNLVEFSSIQTITTIHIHIINNIHEIWFNLDQ
jgi:hypothetical protein